MKVIWSKSAKIHLDGIFNYISLDSEYYAKSVIDRITYLSRKIVTNKYKNDLIHIALATVNCADILVSWNFKHIVHYDKISRFNAVNLEYGYRQLTILSPREVTTYE